jgi:hypothetical protein
LPRMSKRELAHLILGRVVRLMAEPAEVDEY